MILRPVVGTRGQVRTLLAPGDSPHTYDLRPSDLRTVGRSAAVFYGAPHLDAWAADLPDARTVPLLDLVPPAARLAFDSASAAAPGALSLHARGSEPGSEHTGSEHTGSEHTQGGSRVDPHFWTSPAAVRALLPALADTLCAVDAAGCGTYRANADSFATALGALDAQLDSMLRPVRDTPILLAQPFFRYFLHRYGPSLAGVVAPSPARSPSPRDLHTLTQDAQARGVEAIFTQASLPPQAAQAVGEAAGIPLHTLDPLGGTPSRATYDALLEWNAQRIVDALSGTSVRPRHPRGSPEAAS